MNEMMTFNFDGNSVRTVTVDNEPWFVAKDVCDTLGLTNITEALRCLDEDELTSEKLKSGIQLRRMKIVSESGLYGLIMRSNKPEAKRFRKWVTAEVLPTIRKTCGVYMTDDALEKTIQDPDYMIGILQKLKQIKFERDEAIRTKAHVTKGREGTLMSKTGVLTLRVAKLEKENQELVSKYDALVLSSKSESTEKSIQIERLMGMKDLSFVKISNRKNNTCVYCGKPIIIGEEIEIIPPQKSSTFKWESPAHIACHESRLRNIATIAYNDGERVK